jgi:hypothetical protein
METEKLADDLLDGVKAIAAFTGLPERRVYYLAEKKKLPLFKIGDRWAGRKSRLRRDLDCPADSDHGSRAAKRKPAA